MGWSRAREPVCRPRPSWWTVCAMSPVSYDSMGPLPVCLCCRARVSLFDSTFLPLCVRPFCFYIPPPPCFPIPPPLVCLVFRSLGCPLRLSQVVHSGQMRSFSTRGYSVGSSSVATATAVWPMQSSRVEHVPSVRISEHMPMLIGCAGALISSQALQNGMIRRRRQRWRREAAKGMTAAEEPRWEAHRCDTVATPPTSHRSGL